MKPFPTSRWKPHYGHGKKVRWWWRRPPVDSLIRSNQVSQGFLSIFHPVSTSPEPCAMCWISPLSRTPPFGSKRINGSSGYTTSNKISLLLSDGFGIARLSNPDSMRAVDINLEPARISGRRMGGTVLPLSLVTAINFLKEIEPAGHLAPGWHLDAGTRR